MSNLKIKTIRTIQKTSALKHFQDVMEGDDVIKNAEIIGKFLELPKYKKLEAEIKTRSGIIQIVTGGQSGSAYSVLTELFLRKALPPSQAFTYIPFQEYQTGSDFAVDSQHAFGYAPQEAVAKFEESLLGYTEKMSIGHLKDIYGDEDYEVIEGLTSKYRYLGGVKDENEAKKVATAVVSALKQYAAGIKALNKDPRHQKIKELLREIQSNSYIKSQNKKYREQYVKEYYEFNKSYPSKESIDMNVANDEELDSDTLKKLNLRLKALRKELSEARTNLENGFENLNLTLGDEMNPKTVVIPLVIMDDDNKPARQAGTGFLNWTPEGTLAEKTQLLKKYYSAFLNEAKSARTGGANVTEVKDKYLNTLLNIINGIVTSITSLTIPDASLQNLVRSAQMAIGQQDKWFDNLYRDSETIFYNLDAIVKALGKKGKSMIIDNYTSGTLSHEENDKIINHVGKQMKEFSESISAREEAGRGKTSSGNKKNIIIVTEKEVSGLSNAHTIDFSENVVSYEEALILIQYYVKKIQKESRETYSNYSLSKISEKYREEQYMAESDPAALQKVREKIKAEQKDFKTNFVRKEMREIAYFPSTLQNKIASMITGQSHSQAISIIEKTINDTIKVQTDEDGREVRTDLDYATFEQTIRTNINSTTTSKSNAIEVEKPRVTFDDYVYDEESSWGERVGPLAYRFSKIKMLQKKTDEFQKEIDACHSNLERYSGNPEKYQKSIENENKKISEYTKSIERAENVVQTIMYSIPNLVILYGPPGSGKSVFASALADLLGTDVYKVNMSSLFDKWLGNTEKATKQLTSVIENTKHAVFLFDEINREVSTGSGNEGGGGGGGGGGDNAHSTHKGITAALLKLFEDNLPKLKANKTYCVATTNDISAVGSALKSRSTVAEVTYPTTPKGYVSFIQSYVNLRKREFYENPPFIDTPNFANMTTDQKWEEAARFINSLDLEKIGASMLSRKLGFREVKAILEEMFQKSSDWAFFKNDLVAGELSTEELMKKSSRGLAFNTDNLMKAIMLQQPPSPNGSSKDDVTADGVFKLAVTKKKRIDKKLNELSKDPKFVQEMQDIIDPVTNQVVKGKKIPQEILDIMLTEGGDEEFEVTDGKQLKKKQVEKEKGEKTDKALTEVVDEDFLMPVTKIPESADKDLDKALNEAPPKDDDEEDDDPDLDDDLIGKSSCLSDYIVSFMMKNHKHVFSSKKIVSSNSSVKEENFDATQFNEGYYTQDKESIKQDQMNGHYLFGTPQTGVEAAILKINK
jgi:SpoVK/Ycf46/Vps4 family AAA+-type ATPase